MLVRFLTLYQAHLRLHSTGPAERTCTPPEQPSEPSTIKTPHTDVNGFTAAISNTPTTTTTVCTTPLDLSILAIITATQTAIIFLVVLVVVCTCCRKTALKGSYTVRRGDVDYEAVDTASEGGKTFELVNDSI